MARAVAARVKLALKAGEELAFSPVDVLDRKRLSHTIAYRLGRYHVTLADGSFLGTFATLARAGHEGRVATGRGRTRLIGGEWKPI